MERTIQLSNEFQLKISPIEVSKDDKVALRDMCISLDYLPYWYQGYAFRGKQHIMKLRQTITWFSDKNYPYSNAVLPCNAVRLSCIPSQRWPPLLTELRNKISLKYNQTFNSLCIECFDPRGNYNVLCGLFVSVICL